MNMIAAAAAGLASGTVNGLFGGAGGMVLIPLLQWLTDLESEDLFPTSVCVMLPICAFSLLMSPGALPWGQAMPYMLGAIPGGILAGWLGGQIPVKWLHRLFGAMILWGGIRYLC